MDRIFALLELEKAKGLVGKKEKRREKETKRARS